MTLDYDTGKRINDVRALLNEYSGWFLLVLRCLSYPEHADCEDKLVPPELYGQWVSDALEDGLLKELADKLNALQSELKEESDKLLKAALNDKKTPSYEDYNHLVTLYEEFRYHIRRLEGDILLEDSGMDALTGLRSEAVFKKDIGREMDRLARQGKQFSVALIHIDHWGKVKLQNDENLINDCLQKVGEMIRRSVRSFDDAYRMENDEFLLSLKQADMSGGIKAMERLKRELEQQDVKYQLDGETVSMTLSSCIAEPLPEDNVDKLLINLRADLGQASKDDGAVLEYFEMSPLQRYVQQSKE